MNIQNKKVSVKQLLENKEQFRMILETTFRNADTNKNGFIELNELEALMKQVAKDMNIDAPTKEEVKEQLDFLDLNKDGKLSMEEFEGLVVTILQAIDTS